MPVYMLDKNGAYVMKTLGEVSFFFFLFFLGGGGVAVGGWHIEGGERGGRYS